MPEINNENYYNNESNKTFMSCSQFKDFQKCEVEALAKVNGELIEEKTDALYFGGYVDAYFSNELDQFKANNPDMFNSKTGELKAPFKMINEVISAIENDELLMKYLSGEKQVIMTGEISGVPFKIKMDSYFEGKCIVDQKIIKDLDLTWVEREGKNIKTDFIDAYGYAIQGAIYQEIVRQNTGVQLPFILAIELVKELAPRYDAIKKGLVEPIGCGHCASCRKDKKCTEVVIYSNFFKKVME